MRVDYFTFQVFYWFAVVAIWVFLLYIVYIVLEWLPGAVRDTVWLIGWRTRHMGFRHKSRESGIEKYVPDYSDVDTTCASFTVFDPQRTVWDTDIEMFWKDYRGMCS